MRILKRASSSRPCHVLLSSQYRPMVKHFAPKMKVESLLHGFSANTICLRATDAPVEFYLTSRLKGETITEKSGANST